MEYFWTNTIWYLLLGIVTIFTVSYIMRKAEKRKRMFALYLSISGATYMFEVTIFGFLKSYNYHPMIFHRISQLDDALAGNIFSQFSVSATALLIALLNLKKYWYLIIALAYGGIEELFVSLGIYEQYWYRTWMTVAGLILLFSIVRFVYDKIFNAPNTHRIIKYILVFFAVYVPHTLILTWPFRLLGFPAFNDNILPDPNTSVMLLFAISYVSLSIIFMILYYLKFTGWKKAITVSFLYAMYYLGYVSNYIIYKNISMVILFATVQIFGMYLCVYLVDRFYGWRTL